MVPVQLSMKLEIEQKRLPRRVRSAGKLLQPRRLLGRDLAVAKDRGQLVEFVRRTDGLGHARSSAARVRSMQANNAMRIRWRAFRVPCTLRPRA